MRTASPRIRVCILACLFFCSLPLVLRAAEFKQAHPGREFLFPRDHFAHPDFKIEWWYYTGNITDTKGRGFGYELTFFRFGLGRPGIHRISRWAARDIYFAHFALTDKERKRFFYREKTSRGSLGQAGSASNRYQVWIDHWEAEDHRGKHHLVAGDASLGLDFYLQALRPPIVHGRDNISRKATKQGYASHYYSLTRLSTAGTLFFQGRSHKVKGLSWMDHEFGSSQLAEYLAGWDWFGLQLDNNTELMLYVMRGKNGRPDPVSSGTLVLSDGRSEHIQGHEFQIEIEDSWKSAVSGAKYPSGWRIVLPGRKIDLRVSPAIRDQELVTSGSTGITYWEGSVQVEGHAGAGRVYGQGYVELTGYAPDGLGRALK